MLEQETTPGLSSGNGKTGTEYLRERWSETRSELSTADRRMRQFAQERPFLALAAIMVTGYVFGRLVSRL